MEGVAAMTAFGPCWPPAQTERQYFRMRGIDSTCPSQPTYVYWIVADEPDLDASRLPASALPCGSDPSADVTDVHIAYSWWEEA